MIDLDYQYVKDMLVETKNKSRLIEYFRENNCWDNSRSLKTSNQS